MPALRDFARGQLAIAEGRALRRRLTETERIGAGRVRRGGQEFISFSCNDYMGLTHHPAVIAAARDAVERYGVGAGASRLVTGSHPLYDELESLLAEMKGAERALVFSSGYMANIGVIPALVGKGDLILADRLCHACMWDGAKLSGANVLRFDHNDVGHCRELVEANRGAFGRCLILTETVFSMDGDRGPVKELGELAHAHDAWLMTDDAHGLGVYSPQPADVQMGTLSKAVGGSGGYVCGSSELIAWLENRARTLMFSTGLPPASVAAAAAALRIIRDDADLRSSPLVNARRFTARLGRLPAESPIVPVILGEPERALAASAMLESHGLLVVPIRPPSVPPGTARLRFAFSAMHEPDSIDRAAALLREHGYA
jgi:8-amino-7-oxononanoate synthase